MKTWKIRGSAPTAYFAFVMTACESKNNGVADHRPTVTVTFARADGHGGAGNGGVPYDVDDAASGTVYKPEVRESNRRDTSDNERSDRKSGKESESDKKDKPGEKRGSGKEGKPGQRDKSHKEGESNKCESGKIGSGSLEGLTSRNYYFDDDDDEIVTPDGTFIDEDNPITIVKIHNGVAHISSNGRIVRVGGDVKEIDVHGSDVDVIVGSVARVRILGFDANVFVRSVSPVHFNSSNNDVRWTDGPIPPVTGNDAENETHRARPAPAR